MSGHRVLARGHVRRQLRLGSAAARDHDRVHDLRMAGENRLDLAELDPKAANLDLVVDSAEELDGAVAAVAGQVTRPVDPRAWRLVERVRDESLVGEVGSSPVAAGEPLAADPQLAGNPHRDRRH